MASFLIAIIVLALVFDYINGFHDAANSIATVVSTKVLTPFQAVLWAALFNFVAFFIFKDHGVADTIAKTVKKDFVTLEVIFSGLVAAIIWNLFTWWRGIPSSSSHTLIGGLIGAALVHTGSFQSINSGPVIQIALFIFLAPLIGMLMAFIISLWFMYSFRKGWGPKLFSMGVIIAVFIFLALVLERDPAQLKSHYDSYVLKVIFHSQNFKWILLASILLIMASFSLFLSNLNAHKANIWFKRLQLVSSAIFSVGHGGNDAQKVMGIITAALIAGGQISSFSEMPVWVPLACYAAIAVGTMSGGWKIVKTMGTRITKVTPFEGVAAETAGALTLFITESLKIPVSTTHTITGAIMGVGATKRLSAVRWGVTINLLWAWVLTIPISALIAACVYYVVHLF
ncbi:MAG: phosphate transporter [Sphingobacteriales bacterium SCN 48-20]|jgi:PiT family inorganic phosphate transporter|uniref:inorganic phosphate transporter n=1 Tax=Terrimonas ferruginea TaxID=249 RepID=UPI000423526A|nr:inorganic phosphate transporter [Terrimonas ferruginea]MBN8784666.1 inorganic phosphate transporter [Terrimonas ferruginea]ODT91726.1 MAG: phosphate transporter [Sphingobacteriales bacterium SCN 48-20]OJW39610.1 MAG: inorganic phosphate transporter [Sphingobacteriales bacterium 48-107]